MVVDELQKDLQKQDQEYYKDSLHHGQEQDIERVCCITDRNRILRGFELEMRRKRTGVPG